MNHVLAWKRVCRAHPAPTKCPLSAAAPPPPAAGERAIGVRGWVAVRRGSTDARSVAAGDRHATSNRSSRQLGMSGVPKSENKISFHRDKIHYSGAKVSGIGLAPFRSLIATPTLRLEDALVPFPVHEFRGNSTKWAVVETEVSPSDFISAAKNIVCYPPSSARRQK